MRPFILIFRKMQTQLDYCLFARRCLLSCIGNVPSPRQVPSILPSAGVTPFATDKATYWGRAFNLSGGNHTAAGWALGIIGHDRLSGCEVESFVLALNFR